MKHIQLNKSCFVKLSIKVPIREVCVTTENIKSFHEYPTQDCVSITSEEKNLFFAWRLGRTCRVWLLEEAQFSLKRSTATTSISQLCFCSRRSFYLYFFYESLSIFLDLQHAMTFCLDGMPWFFVKRNMILPNTQLHGASQAL